MDKNEASFLLEAATWQDALLQSYRSLHITIQSILLATSAGLFVAVVSIQNFIGSLISLLGLILMFIFHKVSTLKFKRIIIARGEDVNFWHMKILKTETKISAKKRFFTEFKVHQKETRDNADYYRSTFLSDDHEATDAELETLIEKGLGHTRRAIDEQLFRWMSGIWIGIVIICLIFVTLKIIAEVTDWKFLNLLLQPWQDQ